MQEIPSECEQYSYCGETHQWKQKACFCQKFSEEMQTALHRVQFIKEEEMLIIFQCMKLLHVPRRQSHLIESGAVWSLELLQELLHPDRPAHHLIAAPATNLATGAKVRKSRRKIRSFKVENLNLR